ncbi:hypothetical protein AYI69_g5617 [Smittium culicis]|uniref:Uncharacterized protein n=1 Tax=Smittium culicis TaxID=133412 RepID=A0A1R1Y4N2_9FUNG|nr:hypothetical protein AYI69_g5617 [Smittium culicis]
METQSSICHVIQRKDIMTFLNLRDEFLRILVHKNNAGNTCVSIGTDKNTILSPLIWSVPQPTSIHQASLNCSFMGNKIGNTYFSISGQSIDSARNKRSVYIKHVVSLFQDLGSYIHDKF